MNEDSPIPTQQDLSPALVAQRAEEIAVSDGRTAAETSDADYAQARAELAPTAPAEQVNPEPVDGFRRADVAMATPGTQALSGYEDDAQIGAKLVEQGIQEAVHDEFVAGGRETLAEADEETEEAEPEPATFTEAALVPLKKPAPKPQAKAKPAAKKPAPKVAKKVSKPAPKPKAKAKAKPAPKKAKSPVKAKAAKKPAKKVVKAKAKAKAKMAKAKAKKAAPKKAAKKAAKKPGKRKR